MNASRTKPRMNTRTLATLAMLAGLAYLVMFVFRVPIMGAAPFLKFDLKDVIIAIGGFIYGPLASMALSVVVSLLEMITVSESGPIGLVMNILASCAFTLPAAFMYKRRHALSGAVSGLVVGVLAMTGVMLLWNWLITPIYSGMEREVVAAMLLPIFAPFNLIKGGINAAVTILLYKPVVMGLRKARLVPEAGRPAPGSEKAGPSLRGRVAVLVVAAVVLITCVLLVLVLSGVM